MYFNSILRSKDLGMLNVHFVEYFFMVLKIELRILNIFSQHASMEHIHSSIWNLKVSHIRYVESSIIGHVK